MDESRIKDAGSLLSSFFDEEKLRRGGRYAQFFESWRAVVGERLAAHSRVVDLDKGILIVEAEHPGWIQLLQLRQTQALDALAKRFPDLSLRGIAFRLAGAEYRTLAAQSHAEPVNETEEVIETPDESVAPVPEDTDSDGTPVSVERAPEFLAALSSLKKAIQRGKGK